MPNPLTFQQLSKPEQDAAALAYDADCVLPYVLGDDVRPLESSAVYQRAWVSCKIWTIDHLVAMSTECMDALHAVRRPREVMQSIPLDIWDTLEAAISGSPFLPTHPSLPPSPQLQRARAWLDLHRP